ncbi:hypothetical protein pb186bvf_016883, partial [Paramecium bursaria]
MDTMISHISFLIPQNYSQQYFIYIKKRIRNGILENQKELNTISRATVLKL